VVEGGAGLARRTAEGAAARGLLCAVLRCPPARAELLGPACGGGGGAAGGADEPNSKSVAPGLLALEDAFTPRAFVDEELAAALAGAAAQAAARRAGCAGAADCAGAAGGAGAADSGEAWCGRWSVWRDEEEEGGAAGSVEEALAGLWAERDAENSELLAALPTAAADAWVRGLVARNALADASVPPAGIAEPEMAAALFFAAARAALFGPPHGVGPASGLSAGVSWSEQDAEKSLADFSLADFSGGEAEGEGGDMALLGGSRAEVLEALAAERAAGRAKAGEGAGGAGAGGSGDAAVRLQRLLLLYWLCVRNLMAEALAASTARQRARLAARRGGVKSGHKDGDISKALAEVSVEREKEAGRWSGLEARHALHLRLVCLAPSRLEVLARVFTRGVAALAVLAGSAVKGDAGQGGGGGERRALLRRGERLYEHPSPRALLSPLPLPTASQCRTRSFCRCYRCVPRRALPRPDARCRCAIAACAVAVRLLPAMSQQKVRYF